MPCGIFGERATGLEPVNLFLGKEAFYQLNYARKRIRLYVFLAYCQPYFKIPEKVRKFTLDLPDFTNNEIFKVRDC